MSDDPKKPASNDIIDLAIELARRHADASPELTMALREYDAAVGSAWKGGAPTVTDDDILYCALELVRWKKETAAANAEPDDIVDRAREMVRRRVDGSHEPTLPRRQRGRPRRVAAAARAAEQANRNASWLVAFMMQEWREKHGRERVPGHEINAIVSKAIAEAAREFGVSVSQIDADNVRDNAQKTGRFVVRR